MGSVRLSRLMPLLLLPGVVVGCGRTDCAILLEGSYPGHLQDVFIARDSIWWAHTEYLVRTDRDGKVVRKAEVGGHHAGLAVKDDRLYAAVCAYNGEPRWQTTDSCHVMVGEYDAWTLERIKMHVLEINDRAGSFCIMPDGSYLIGCLRHPSLKSTEVKFHHVDGDFKLIETHVVDAGIPIELGIEVMRCEGDEIYLFLNRKLVITLDANDFGLKGVFESGGGDEGFFREGDRVWIGRSYRKPNEGVWRSEIRLEKPLWKAVAGKWRD